MHSKKKSDHFISLCHGSVRVSVIPLKGGGNNDQDGHYGVLAIAIGNINMAIF